MGRQNLKAVSALDPVHVAQVINYLKATGHQVAVLLNFGAPSLEKRRLILSGSASQVVGDH